MAVKDRFLNHLLGIVHLFGDKQCDAKMSQFHTKTETPQSKIVHLTITITFLFNDILSSLSTRGVTSPSLLLHEPLFFGRIPNFSTVFFRYVRLEHTQSQSPMFVLECLKIRGSLTKPALQQLREKDLIKQVVENHS